MITQNEEILLLIYLKMNCFIWKKERDIREEKLSPPFSLSLPTSPSFLAAFCRPPLEVSVQRGGVCRAAKRLLGKSHLPSVQKRGEEDPF